MMLPLMFPATLWPRCTAIKVQTIIRCYNGCGGGNRWPGPLKFPRGFGATSRTAEESRPASGARDLHTGARQPCVQRSQ